MKRLGPTRRGGFSLIEMLVAMVVGAAILTMMIVLLSRLIVANGAQREHAGRSGALADLAAQLRGDARAASGLAAIDPQDSSRRLVLQLAPGRRIDYEIADGVLKRSLREGDTVLARNTLAVPGARIEKFTIEKLTVEPGAQGALVSLVVERPSGLDAAEGARGKPLVIEARVGRDRRFVRAEAPEEERKR
jgi:prepilin-type N-terminal cleavage/methylation domain-containing protein